MDKRLVHAATRSSSPALVEQTSRSRDAQRLKTLSTRLTGSHRRLFTDDTQRIAAFGRSLSQKRKAEGSLDTELQWRKSLRTSRENVRHHKQLPVNERGGGYTRRRRPEGGTLRNRGPDLVKSVRDFPADGQNGHTDSSDAAKVGPIMNFQQQQIPDADGNKESRQNHESTSGVEPPGQTEVPPKNDNGQDILAHVAQVRQSQGPFTGWRAEISVRDRSLKTHQMITSLRLLQPEMNLQNAAQAAMNFEQKAFKEANARTDYDREFSNKLVEIRDTRARQMAAVMQDGTGSQGAASSVAGPGKPPPSIQPKHPNEETSLLPSGAAGVAGLSDGVKSLPQQEDDNIVRIATLLHAECSPEDLAQIRTSLENITPEQELDLSKKAMDSLPYFFYSLALNKLRGHLLKERARGGQTSGLDAQSKGVDPSNAMIRDDTIPPQDIIPLEENLTFLQGSRPSSDANAMRTESKSPKKDDMQYDDSDNEPEMPKRNPMHDTCNNEPRLCAKRTISEDHSNGLEADRLKKLRAMFSRRRRGTSPRLVAHNKAWSAVRGRNSRSRR